MRSDRTYSCVTAANFFLFPSFDTISRTEEILPPYRLGIPPLYNVTSFIISEFTAEKNPKKCEELYIGAPYRQDKVLVSGATSYIKSGRAFPNRLNSGYKENAFYYV